MQVNWLIDGEMFPAYREELVDCIRRQGHNVHCTKAPTPPFRWDDDGHSYRRAFPEGSCVVAHGDMELVLRIRNDRRWKPGVFATVENFFCSHYYPHFGRHLLNDRYVMLPFGELLRCREFLFDTVGCDGRVFVRPDSPLKLFTGQVATAADFEKDVEYMGFYEFPLNSLVVVSVPRQIEAEWRFVVADRHVVAGSRYKVDGKLESTVAEDATAEALAHSVAAADFQPDPVWVVDVCRTSDGDYRLLEIGGFSFADLYACDKSAVVAAVSQVAAETWTRNAPT